MSAKSILLASWLNVAFVAAVIVLAPAWPRLVKICTTPLFAREPYSAAAAAPLMTSTRSMSSGSRSASRLEVFER